MSEQQGSSESAAQAVLQKSAAKKHFGGEFRLNDLLQSGVHQETLHVDIEDPIVESTIRDLQPPLQAYPEFQDREMLRATSSNPMHAPTTSSLVPPPYVAPNREVAKNYFNNQRPRRIKDCTQPTGHRRAKQREICGDDGEPSKPYDFFRTGDDALDEFGTGISLYFKSLKVLAVVFLLCALISLIAVYENKKHQYEKEASINQVELPVYNNATRQNLETPLRMLGSVYGVIRSDLKFYKQGISDIAVTVILVVVALTGYYFERLAVRRIDEQQLTTKDYSVVVRNPPAHITDPNVYHRHFSQFGEVVFVSIVKNNGELIRKIGMLKDKQKMLMGRISIQTAPHAVPKLTRRVTSLMESFGLSPGIEKLVEQIEQLKMDISTLVSLEYKPYKVYIVFNSEESRKNCVYDTAVSERTIWRNSVGQNVSSVLQGFVLKVKNAREPGDYIYEYSDVDYMKLYGTLAGSYAATIALLSISYGIIYVLIHNTGEIPVAVAVSLMNSVLPQAVQYITIFCEIHNSEIDTQKSVLTKLLVARCVNSALLLYMVTPYRETFSLQSLERVQNILLADAITTPVFRLVNPVDMVMRYAVAPLMSTTQAQYNKFWMGAKWNLAERYSDVLKSVFVGTFFAPVMPSGLFMTTFAVILTYLVDKYSLYHLWRRMPNMGPDVAYLARYFYFITVLFHLQFALIYFANWPYRGVFETDTAAQPVCGFLVCSVNDDMTDDQKKLVRVYTLSTIIAFAVLCFWGLPYRLFKLGKRIFYPYRKDKSGDASDVPFRSLKGVNAYIPLVRRGAYLTPYIVAHVSNVPKRYIPLHSGLNWDELPDPKEFSVFNRIDFAHIPDEQLMKVISTVTYYGSDDNISKEMKAKRSSSSPPLLRESLQTDVDGIEMLPPLSSAPMLQRQKSARVSVNIEEDMQLPTGWEKRRGPDGEEFYMDNNTNMTHFTAPTVETTAPHFLSNKSASTFLSSRNLRADADVMMLDKRESIVHVTLDSGNLYRASTGGSGYQSEGTSSVKAGIAVLPPGWEELFTPDGVPYFVDHNTKTSQWSLPDEIKDFVIKSVGKRKSL